MKSSNTSTLTPPETRYLKQKQVADMLNMSEAWLERKRWEGGGIPFRKFGTSVRYAEVDVLQWIDEHPRLTHSSIRPR